MVLVALAVAWVVIGVATGIVEARRGHWAKTWVLGPILGPFAVALALGAWRGRSVAPRPLSEGRAHEGDLDVLVGVDGSAASRAAVMTAAQLFGARIRRITVATVLDFETAAPHGDSALNPEPWDEERSAEATLQSTIEVLSDRAGVVAGSVLLAGRPADALESFAVEQGYDVLVIGCRGRGLSKAVLGSCASRLAARSHVPMLLIPEPQPETSSTSAQARN